MHVNMCCTYITVKVVSHSFFSLSREVFLLRSSILSVEKEEEKKNEKREKRKKKKEHFQLNQGSMREKKSKINVPCAGSGSVYLPFLSLSFFPSLSPLSKSKERKLLFQPAFARPIAVQKKKGE